MSRRLAAGGWRLAHLGADQSVQRSRDIVERGLVFTLGQQALVYGSRDPVFEFGQRAAGYEEHPPAVGGGAPAEGLRDVRADRIRSAHKLNLRRPEVEPAPAVHLRAEPISKIGGAPVPVEAQVSASIHVLARDPSAVSRPWPPAASRQPHA